MVYPKSILHPLKPKPSRDLPSLEKLDRSLNHASCLPRHTYIVFFFQVFLGNMAETTPDTESNAAPASPRENVISSRGYDGRREEWTSCNGSGHRPLCVDAERLGASKVGRRRVVRGPFDGGGDASIEAADGGRVHLMKSSRSLSDLAAAPEVVDDASPRRLLAANAALAAENARLRSCEERGERRRRADKALIEVSSQSVCRMRRIGLNSTVGDERLLTCSVFFQPQLTVVSGVGRLIFVPLALSDHCFVSVRGQRDVLFWWLIFCYVVFGPC